MNTRILALSLMGALGSSYSLAQGLTTGGQQPVKTVRANPSGPRVVGSVNMAGSDSALDETSIVKFVHLKDEYIVTLRGRVVDGIKVNGVVMPAEEVAKRTKVEGDDIRILDAEGGTLARFAAPIGSGLGNSLPSTTTMKWVVPSGKAPGAPDANWPEILDPEEAAARTVMVGLQMVPVEQALVGHFGLDPGCGIMVSAVADDLPAAAAGLKPFDIILTIDTKPVEQVDALKEALTARKAKAGDTLKMTVLQGGVKREIVVQLMAFDNTKFSTTRWVRMPYDPQTNSPGGGGLFGVGLAGTLGHDAEIAAKDAANKSGKTYVRVPGTRTTDKDKEGAKNGKPGLDNDRQILIMGDPTIQLAEDRLARLEERLARLEMLLTRLVETKAGGKDSKPAGSTGSPEKK